MTVSTTRTFDSVVADGATTVFVFEFQTLQTAWVKVSETTTTGVTTRRTDATVTLNANQEQNPGGTVTLQTAPANGSLVVIFRDVPPTQGTDFTNYDAFPAEAHEDALDKLTMLAQQLGLRANLGYFDGINVTQLAGRGFASIARTALVPAGSWDITLLDPIPIDANMLLWISGPTFGNQVASYNLGRIDDQSLRVQVSYIPNGTEVVNTPIDSVFYVLVVDASQ